MHPIRPVRSIRATVVIVLSTILAMSISACSSESELTNIADDYSYTGAPIPISISAAGIETFGSRPVTRSGAMKDTNVDPLDDDYNFVSSIESEDEQPQPLTRAALGDGIYFRVLAYRNDAVSTENFAGAADYKTNGDVGLVTPAGSNSTLKLSPGKYIFICYSYNKPEPIKDNFDGAAGTSIGVSHGMDFLSAKQEATVQADANGTYTLPGFTFSHMCARVYLEMTLNEKITECSAKLSNLSSAPVQWQVGDVSIPNSGQGGTAALTWSSPNAAIVTSEPMYILPNDARNVTVSLTYKAGNTTYTNKTFELPSRAFSSATSYKITAKQKENSISIEGLSFKVAAGNVVLKDDKYQMQATQGDYTLQWNGGDYFNWGATDPTNYTVDNSKFTTDVCQKLGSQWRTPNQSEMKQFTTCKRIWGTYSGTNRGTVKGYYFGTTSVPSSDKKDNYVFLPAAGYRDYGSTSLSDGGTYGRYWASTPSGYYAYYLNFYSSDCYLNSGYCSRGLSVRCIAD